MHSTSGLISCSVGLCRNDFGLADHAGAVDDLALQVAEVHGVVVAQGELADTARRQIQRRGRTQSAHADDEHAAIQQALLPFDADLLQQDVAAVAE